MLDRRSLLRGLLSAPAAEGVKDHPRSGDVLILRWNPYNPHDGRAVAIWRGADMLGRLPKGENMAVSQMMDRGDRLVASLGRVEDHADSRWWGHDERA